MTPAGTPAGSVNFPNMKRALAKSVRALVESEHHVIVDLVFCGQKTQKELQEELEEQNLLFVKLYCCVDELNRREKARGDRKSGLAESQLHTVHQGVRYDLVLDTNLFTPEQCTEEVISVIK